MNYCNLCSFNNREFPTKSQLQTFCLCTKSITGLYKFTKRKRRNPKLNGLITTIFSVSALRKFFFRAQTSSINHPYISFPASLFSCFGFISVGLSLTMTTVNVMFLGKFSHYKCPFQVKCN